MELIEAFHSASKTIKWYIGKGKEIPKVIDEETTASDFY